jgi:hypothetical protein
MYAIITSKPGQYKAHACGDVAVVETYEYMFYGKLKAVFQVIELEAEVQIQIVEDDPPHATNIVSTKFLDKFESLEAVQSELKHLISFGGLKATLRKCDAQDIWGN